MINLLPQEAKDDVMYAKRNVKLVGWVIAITFSTLGILAIIGFGQLYLTQASNTYTKQIEEGRERLRIQKLDETQKRVSNISGNINLVLEVLSREILFSKVLQQVGGAIPPGSVLTQLELDKIEGGIDLNFESMDYQTGSQILLNLQDPANKIFEQADIESISCRGEAEENNDDRIYPCTVSIRALFGDNSPYLFINKKAGQ